MNTWNGDRGTCNLTNGLIRTRMTIERCMHECRKNERDLSSTLKVRFTSNMSLLVALAVEQHLMTSDDDLPLVSPYNPRRASRAKAPKRRPPRSTVGHEVKPPRFSKYLDMHAKEGDVGFTASEGEISDADQDRPNLSCVTSDEGSPPSDHMHSVYHQSLGSQAANMGFGTPMHKKRAKEKGHGFGSIFDSIVEKNNKKRELQPVPLLDIRDPFRVATAAAVKSPLPLRTTSAAAVMSPLPLWLPVSSPSRGAAVVNLSSPSRGVTNVSNEQRFNRLKLLKKPLHPYVQPECDKSHDDKSHHPLATSNGSSLNLAVSCSANKHNSKLKFDIHSILRSSLLQNAVVVVADLSDKSPKLSAPSPSHSLPPSFIAGTPDSTRGEEARRRLAFEPAAFSALPADVTRKNVETQTLPRSSDSTAQEEVLTLKQLRDELKAQEERLTKQLRDELKAFAIAFGF
jgi:hypothetical protein